MKTFFPLVVLIVELGLASLSAQTFTTLHSFSSATDGANPNRLLLLNNLLYGTAERGGALNSGTLFSINTDGSGFTNLCSLPTTTGFPRAGLIASGDFLYGTASGFSLGSGGVFRIQTNGLGLTNLYNFSSLASSNGYTPEANLVLSNDVLYGTTDGGGASPSSGTGTIFKLDTNSGAFSKLYSFAPIAGGTGLVRNPELVLAGEVLYGVTHIGGDNPGSGAVFRLKTDGTEFTNLHSFSFYSSASPTNVDGARPFGGLVLGDGVLYGTTRHGGSAGKGNIFSINTDGTGFTNLHDFVESDGYDVQNKLLLVGNVLYGTAKLGGASSNGTIFCMNIDGTDFQTLYTFSAGTRPGTTTTTNTDGALPDGGLVLMGDTLYGTASSGGLSASGTIFSLTLPPPKLNVSRTGSELILSWSTNFSGFALQSTISFTPPVAWETSSQVPTVVGGRYIVTNLIADTERFYRLSR